MDRKMPGTADTFSEAQLSRRWAEKPPILGRELARQPLEKALFEPCLGTITVTARL